MDQASGLHTGDTGDLEQVGLGNGGSHDGVAGGAHIHVQEEAIPHLVGDGACICYSGQCQMSRILGRGERSGNRGLCAQPCRLPYKDDKGKTACILSPKDLCTVDDLGELTEAGVTLVWNIF